MKSLFSALLFVCASSSWAAPKPAVFFQPKTISMTAPPAGIAVADINNDGYPDIVTANRPLGSGTGSNKTVSVMLNKGNGKFGAATSWAVGADPSEVAVADVNGDGFPDLIVVCATGDSGNGDVEVLYGKGDGSFQAAIVIATQLSAPLAVADFNGDGKPDIAVEGLLGIAIFLGNGDGTFTKLAANQSCLSDAPFAVGDFNGDGKLDIASLCAAQNVTQNLVVLLGNGDGTFSAGQVIQSIGLNVQGGGVVAGKFTDGANLDLAISLTGPVSSAVTGNLAIYSGDGHGIFTENSSFISEIHPKAPITADFNNDGYPDIAVPNLAGDSLSVYLNSGTGTLSAPVTWTVGAFPVEVAAGDFNLDGFIDLAITGNADSTIAVLTGDGTGSFNSPLSLDATDPLDTVLTTLDVAVADFNNDGFPDIVTSAGTVLLGDGTGGFHPPAQVAAITADLVLTATLTSTKNADIILASGSTLTVLLGAGNGTFPQTVSTTTPGTIQSVITGDFNGDGATDLVVLTKSPSRNAGAYLYLGTYTGAFQTPKLIASGEFTAVAAGTFHKNEALSVVLVGKPVGGVSPATIMQGLGNGTFEPPVAIDIGLAAVTTMLAADVNFDNTPDLVLSGVSSGGANKISVLLAKGDGTFESPKTTAPLLLPILAIAVADFNGDGKVDIAASQGNSIDILLSQGGGKFTKQTGALTVPGGNSLAPAQLTPNTRWSLVVGNAVPDSVWTFLNKTL